jgi:hypothetical protein
VFGAEDRIPGALDMADTDILLPMIGDAEYKNNRDKVSAFSRIFEGSLC